MNSYGTVHYLLVMMQQAVKLLPPPSDLAHRDGPYIETIGIGWPSAVDLPTTRAPTPSQRSGRPGRRYDNV